MSDHKTTHSYVPHILVWFALLILTGVTVAIAGMDFGRYTVATALLIATIKSYLVLNNFYAFEIGK